MVVYIGKLLAASCFIAGGENMQLHRVSSCLRSPASGVHTTTMTGLLPFSSGWLSIQRLLVRVQVFDTTHHAFIVFLFFGQLQWQYW